MPSAVLKARLMFLAQFLFIVVLPHMYLAGNVNFNAP